jgi:hypothetical protein
MTKPKEPLAWRPAGTEELGGYQKGTTGELVMKKTRGPGAWPVGTQEGAELGVVTGRWRRRRRKKKEKQRRASRGLIRSRAVDKSCLYP